MRLGQSQASYFAKGITSRQVNNTLLIISNGASNRAPLPVCGCPLPSQKRYGAAIRSRRYLIQYRHMHCGSNYFPYLTGSLRMKLLTLARACDASDSHGARADWEGGTVRRPFSHEQVLMKKFP